MKRNATAVWQGNLQGGSGALTTESEVLFNSPYSFGTRFKSKPGTNPEELLAAAHAGCFSMALSAELENFGFVAESIETHAEVSLEKVQDDWGIVSVHLKVSAQVPGATETQFTRALESAKQNCPVSKVLKARITVQAELSSSVVPPLQEAG